MPGFNFVSSYAIKKKYNQKGGRDQFLLQKSGKIYILLTMLTLLHNYGQS